MDYEYKLLRGKDLHNRCCGGRAWCVQVSYSSFDVTLAIKQLILDQATLTRVVFSPNAGYMRHNMCCYDMVTYFIRRICCDGRYYTSKSIPIL